MRPSHAHACTYMHMRAHTCTCVHIHAHACAYMHMRAHTSMSMYTYTYAYRGDDQEEPRLVLPSGGLFLRRDVCEDRGRCVHAEDRRDACAKTSSGAHRRSGHVDLEETVAHLHACIRMCMYTHVHTHIHTHMHTHVHIQDAVSSSAPFSCPAYAYTYTHAYAPGRA